MEKKKTEKKEKKQVKKKEIEIVEEKEVKNSKLSPKQIRTIIISLVFIIAIIVVLLLVRTKVEEATYFDKIYFAGEYQDPIIGSKDYLFVSEEELKYMFPDQEFKDVDFENHHYALVTISYDSCSEENIKPIRYSIKENVITVEVEYEAKCGLCAPEATLYYLVEIDKEITDATVNIEYHATNNPHCDPNVAYKPMIYLYPEKEEIVTVTLGNPSYLTNTYPSYEDNWMVMAYPDGTLKNISTGREYYGLYWEGSHHTAYVHDTGFIVKGENALSFLEEKLSILGLTDREANEFIVYWLPKLQESEEINSYMPLTITPTPDSIIRIQMDYLPLTQPIPIKEQQLVPAKREGFQVVEWGGSFIKK